MKLEDIIKQEYYVYLKQRVKKTHFEEQVIKIEKHILPFFKQNIEEVGLKDFIFWKEYIENQNYKFNYKSYLYYALNNIIEYLIINDYMNKNYLKLIGNFKNYDIENTGNIWTIEEFNNFINVIDKKEDKVLFEILFYSGMRKGELLALKWKDIDFENNTININKTITRNHELTTPKTRTSIRKISMPRKILYDLKEIKNGSEEDIIFNISFTQLERIKNRYCKKANIKQIKIHEFRHSHACYLYQNKIEVKDISERLGHSNMATTMNIYLKYLPKNEKRVIKLLNSHC